MSVTANRRRSGKLEVLTKANELCVYTIKICANPNIFLPEFQNALTDDIIKTSKNIFMYAWKANGIVVGRNYENKISRLNYQELAIDSCNDLLALMQIAQKLFHLKSKRIEYWGKLTIEVRTMLRAWKNSDERRYVTIGM